MKNCYNKLEKAKKKWTMKFFYDELPLQTGNKKCNYSLATGHKWIHLDGRSNSLRWLLLGSDVTWPGRFLKRHIFFPSTLCTLLSAKVFKYNDNLWKCKKGCKTYVLRRRQWMTAAKTMRLPRTRPAMMELGTITSTVHHKCFFFFPLCCERA